MPELRERILETCLEVGGEHTWASGMIANNKLDTDRAWEDEELRQDILTSLGKLAIDLNPRVIVPIPDGANKWGKALGKELDLPVRNLRVTEKEPGLRAYRYKMPLWPPKPQGILIFDDVENYLTSLQAVLNMPVHRSEIKVAGFLSIFDRGPEGRTDPVGLEKRTLVKQYIPAQIHQNSPFGKYIK